MGRTSRFIKTTVFPQMKNITRLLVVGGLLALIAWAMSFIGSEENSIRLNTDWGIAKDHPLR
jgi:hypothetical protein